MGDRRSGSVRRDAEGGAVAIMVALLTVVLVSVLAFVTDFGMAYANKRVLQNAADAAALAAARTVVMTAGADQDCAEVSADATVRDEAWNVAVGYLTENAPGADGPPAAAPADFLACGPGEPGVLTVSVDASQDSPTSFAGVTGVDRVPLTEGAAAVIGPAGTPPGLRPIAMCQTAARAMTVQPDELFVYSLDNVDSGCGSAAGNWGMVSYDCTNSGEAVGGWLEDGYTGPVDIAPAEQCGNPGMDTSSHVRAALPTILDKEIIIPVYDAISGSGDGARVRIVSFVSVKICAWKMGNGEGKSGTSACADDSTLPTSSSATYFQLKYVRAVPPAEITDSCSLGDPTCDFGLRVVKLGG